MLLNLKKTFTSILFFIIPFCLIAQNEASFWYFGQNAGLRFDNESGTVTAITDGQLNTLEGCTSISDTNGELLFYSDGRSIWNRNHQIMTNANYSNGNGLLGDPSSTSSGLIVPKPEDPTKFYIFTVDEPHHQNASVHPAQFTSTYDSGGSVPNADDGFNNGLNYSLVDINLDGGLGNVNPAEKNVPLITFDTTNPLHQSYKCSEKITAVRADDCSSFWVITHFANSFYAFKIDSSGVNPTPVISTVGPNVPPEGYRRNALGYLKASPDGSKLVVAHFGFSNVTATDAPGGVYLFDFDNNTGVITNSIELYGPENNSSPYGVEFSSENRKVYATVGFSGGNPASQVLQWDLESVDIPNSIQIIHSSNTLTAGALQLGIDKRIYRAQLNFSSIATSGRFLGVINNPESDGNLANYNEQGILLDINNTNQNLSRIGLPPFIQSLFNTQIDIIQNGESSTELTICSNETYTLAAENIPGADYIWTLDTIILTEDSDGNPVTNTTFELKIDEFGFYEVVIEPNNGECPIEGSALVQIFDIPQANDAKIFQCDEDGMVDGMTRFNLNQFYDAVTGGVPNRAIAFFDTPALALDINSTPLSADDFMNSSPIQTLSVRVTNTDTGCFNIATVTLEVSSTSANDATINLCDDDGIEDGEVTFTLSDADADVLDGLPSGLDISYYLTLDDALLENNPLNDSYTSNSNTIFVRVEDNNNCFGINEVKLIVSELPQLESDEQILYCLNTFPDTITLNSGLINPEPTSSYLWSTGEITQNIEVNTPEDYTISITNDAGCTKERTITVLPSNTATITQIDITDASTNNTVVVTTTGEGTYQFALDFATGPYQDSNTFENVSPGFHTVYVNDIKNNCGITQEDIAVIGFPKFFTPNGDGQNDVWAIKGLGQNNRPNTTIHIYNRFGKLLKQLSPNDQGWDGTFNGLPLPDSDYWFSVTLQDGRSFTSHFSLKR